ncbi:hypothetical protein [Hymenobacter sp. BRD67]|uniref:hypothetical protein n=1 Tax=Hymenobacter sp. BRD67 TaxID=2675877 RepID=UPI0015648BF8|nr:hypothetical protein [Hymenobacter sp. BRD67]QKG52859.1 hypothetical protein GKZ67_09895 [Hymenobacter sp. BRD67]
MQARRQGRLRPRGRVGAGGRLDSGIVVQAHLQLIALHHRNARRRPRLPCRHGGGIGARILAGAVIRDASGALRRRHVLKEWVVAFLPAGVFHGQVQHLILPRPEGDAQVTQVVAQVVLIHQMGGGKL